MASQTQPTSAATTIVPSQPTSRAQSLKGNKEAGALEQAEAPASTKPLDVHVDQGQRPVSKDRAPVFVVVLCLFQSLAGLLFGWESGGISGLVNCRDYQMRFGTVDPTSVTGYSIPSTRQALITSFMGLGALFGSLLAGRISGKLGIKVAYLISLVIFLIGVAIELSSMTQWGQMLAGRFIAGYGVGALSMLAPLYQAECSPKHLRGMITSTYQLCATFGIFFANVVNYKMHDVDGPLSWRLTIALQLVWGAFVLVGTVFCPESPRYYVMRGNIDQARINLGKLRDLAPGDEELEAEIQEYVARQKEEEAAGDASYIDCFRSEGRMGLRTAIGIAVQAGQQWSGVNFFFSYGVKFFAAAGISDSFLIQVILGAVNVISTFPGLLAVEKLGRRQTLFIGSFIMFTGQVVAGALGTAYPDGEVAGKILITFSCIYIFGFASSWGPLGWVVAAEQFPVRMAPYCVAFATGSNWLNNFILAMITPYITDAGYGNLQAKITFIWAAAIVLFTAFVFFFVPETKGLSLVQVDELYLSRVPAWRSSSWVPFGGASKRNATDGGSLKLQTTQKHHENVQPRNLDDDEE
ncbi:and other transporter-domain-containing protein [Leucosporidium creatinivorum]|uniref:And other transporter-domain-containing protein n=1 Tax=Leucosporidium creatinivorum TaxID=106004 RepID=A0A1Y2FX03_9BASI|nr:and other transporter-domain-containing protein [Leucosporidium creatinivorum]